MSEKGYWKARPEARAVYDARVQADEQKNFAILAQGLNFASAILGVFGVCIANIELISASAAMLMLAKAFS